MVQSTDDNQKKRPVRQRYGLPWWYHYYQLHPHNLVVHISLYGLLLCLHAKHVIRATCKYEFQVSSIYDSLFCMLIKQ